MALKLSNAAYAMDQVLPLPLRTAEVIRSLFYPPTARGAPVPTLCRLYFGKVIKSSKRPIAYFDFDCRREYTSWLLGAAALHA